MIKPEVYYTLSDVAFKPLANSGQHLVILEGLSGPQVVSIRKEHEERFSGFLIYDQINKVLKSLLIATVDNKYIRGLYHKYVGYTNIKIITMLNHLYASYARITPTDLEENNKRLKESCDPN